MPTLLMLLCWLAFATTLHAEVQTRVITYEDEGTPLTGYLYWDDAVSGQRPGVLVVHEWWGLNDYAKRRARMLAELGYLAFAADMYGGDRVTEDPKQAEAWMREVTADPAWWRQRAARGLEQLTASDLLLPGQIAAIGYCFGGATVLQLAYGGAPIKGVVSFHGSLPLAPTDAKGQITAKILVLHGHADSFFTRDAVTTFQDQLSAAGADWEMDIYGGVRHSFTNPGADDVGIANLKYDAGADARSWQRMRSFFGELFGR